MKHAKASSKEKIMGKPLTHQPPVLVHSDWLRIIDVLNLALQDLLVKKREGKLVLIRSAVGLWVCEGAR